MCASQPGAAALTRTAPNIECITSLDRHPNRFHPNCPTIVSNGPDGGLVVGRTDTLGLFGLFGHIRLSGLFRLLLSGPGRLRVTEKGDLRPFRERLLQPGSRVQPHELFVVEQATLIVRGQRVENLGLHLFRVESCE